MSNFERVQAGDPVVQMPGGRAEKHTGLGGMVLTEKGAAALNSHRARIANGGGIDFS